MSYAVGKRFGAHAAIYLVSTMLMRGLSVFLTPLYTRVMTTADFAQLAIANTLLPALTIVIGLSLYGCIARFYHDYETEVARREFLGTIAIVSAVVPVGVALVLDVTGRLGALNWLGIPFRPYVELVLWAAVLGNFCTIPIALFTATEKPAYVSALNLSSGVLQLVMNVILVAMLRQGAVGVLRASAVSAAVMTVASLVLLRSRVSFTFSWRLCRAAVRYSLPLVPHLLANWALAISDRLILARSVTDAELAHYAVAYLPATGIAIVGAAVVTPVTASANRRLGDPETAAEIPPLGTYALLASVATALLVSVNAPEVIAILAPPQYGSAGRITPWVVLGAVFQTGYLILSVGTWYSKKTAAVPVITGISVAINIALNIVLIPRYGVMMAAYSTVIGYALSALLHGLLAHRNHPIPWEYRRWAGIVVSAVAAFFLVRWISVGSVVGSLVVKTLVASLLFGGGLIALGVVSFGTVMVLVKRVSRA